MHILTNSFIYTFGECIDVLSQIRDLQLAIEDFNNDSAENSIEPTCSESCSEQQQNMHDKNEENVIDNTAQQQNCNAGGEEKTLVYSSDEKTAIEEPFLPQDNDNKVIMEEKTLVEEEAKEQDQVSYLPLDKLNIRFSDDFSILMDQFNNFHGNQQQQQQQEYNKQDNKQVPTRMIQVKDATFSEPGLVKENKNEKKGKVNREGVDECGKEKEGSTGGDHNNYIKSPPSALLSASPINNNNKIKLPAASTATKNSTMTEEINLVTQQKQEQREKETPILLSAEANRNDKYLVEDQEHKELTLSFPLTSLPPPPPPPPLIITAATTTTSTSTTTTSPVSSTNTPINNNCNSPMALSVCYAPEPFMSSPLIATPKSRSSISSRRSRRLSTLSKKSSKSSRYFPKQLKQEQTQQLSDDTSNSNNVNNDNTTYHPRSYAEMMRVPNTRERIAFYERTFKQCIRANSKLSLWIKQTKEKGLPKPMTEGYTPPTRPVSPEIQPTPTMSSSLSGSISTFLRKASVSNSVTLPRRAAFSSETPKPSLSRLFLPTSMSRLSLSRSSRPKILPYNATVGVDDDNDHIDSSQQHNSPYQQPKTASNKRQSQKPPRPSIECASANTRRWRGSLRLSASSSRRTSTESLPTISSPLSTTSSASSKLSRRTTLRKASCDTVLQINERSCIPTYEQQQIGLKQKKSLSTLPPPRKIKPVEQGPDAALNELCNVLPQLDRKVLHEYLDEAGGDPMVAITLAMSQYKKVPTNSNDDTNNINNNRKMKSDNSNNNLKKQSMYKQRQRVK
ncbi:hypothetical protein BDC45DRAFT_516275 [Circinella umbellata]|nr:hypothetical protein BDC45DRAFT_516275 [Circinella umbellata]